MFKKFVPYVFSAALSLGIGALSSFLTKDSMPIYSSINRPKLSPPSEVFPVVWTILFVFMGIAAALVWCSNGRHLDFALLIYGLQLVFNFCWSIIFFNFRAFLFSFIWLLILLVLIGITAVNFFKIKKLAGILLLPYFAWTAFAGYLNFMIWMLN